MTLFRPEVQQAQAAQWLGSVRLHRPLSFAVLTTAALGLALALVAFAAWGEVNRKARLSGLLVPSLGSLSLTAQQSGVLRQLPISEGQTLATLVPVTSGMPGPQQAPLLAQLLVQNYPPAHWLGDAGRRVAGGQHWRQHQFF